MNVDSDALAAAVHALGGGSRTLAAAEIKHRIGCSQLEAEAWLDHLLHCTRSWPFADEDRNVMKVLENVFGRLKKPEHFTNPTHCDECEEHDRVLLAAGRSHLQRKDLGNPGWDPLNFCDEQGTAYLFPALARFALIPDIWPDRDWYASQLLFHLSADGSQNRLLVWCTAEQRFAIHSFLKHLKATRQAELQHYGEYQTIESACDLWQS